MAANDPNLWIILVTAPLLMILSSVAFTPLGSLIHRFFGRSEFVQPPWFLWLRIFGFCFAIFALAYAAYLWMRF